MTAETAPVRYVALDVVGFTTGRSVEAQADVVDTLNMVIESVLADLVRDVAPTILIPTGDGVCISILGSDGEYDLHIAVALEILRRLDALNGTQPDKRRQFKVRIGVNSNIDNIVKDINGQRNVAGAGINRATRIMDLADGGQILVGPSVYEVLRDREKYVDAFRSYSATVKHGETLPVYQLVASHIGLDTDAPKRLEPTTWVPPKLDRLVACYLAHAIRHRDLFVKVDDKTASIVWLWFSAQDMIDEEQRTPAEKPPVRIKAKTGATPEEQLKHYCSIDHDVIWELAEFIFRTRLMKHGPCFEGIIDFRFVTDLGKRQLQEQWPDLWTFATQAP